MHPIYIALWMRMRLSHAYWEQREVIEPVHLASKAALRLAGTGRRCGSSYGTMALVRSGLGVGSHSRETGGLGNTKARVEEAGGWLTITSAPGSTKVTATLPRPLLQRFPLQDKRSSD